jgi:hypothetical protein
MVNVKEDLLQLKGIGRVLVKRLQEAGLDSFAKVAQAGEAELLKINGINPHKVSSIVEQAKLLSEAAHAGHQARIETLQLRLTEVKEKVQALAETTRERFQQELAGKWGKKLSSDLVRIEDALGLVVDGGKKSAKRAGKALDKAQKRVDGLEGASLKKVHKGFKKARKAVLSAL